MDRVIPLLMMLCSEMLLYACAASGQTAQAGEPVMTLVKLGTGFLSQRYEVRVYADRRGLYDGKANVRQRGEVPFKLDTDQYERLVRTLTRIGGLPEATSMFGHVADLTINLDGQPRTVKLDYLADPQTYQSVMAELEQELNTRKWRCPYVVQLTNQAVDVCQLSDGQKEGG